VDFEEQIVNFKADLSNLDTLAILNKYVYANQCACLIPAQHDSLKTRISGKFGIEANNIVVVGSSKTGFSIAPEKRYAPFGDSSDIDIAIISSDLYVKVWYELFDYQRSGAHWESKECEHYCFRGWIRPDKLPRSNTYPFSKAWWEFFQSLTSSNQYGPYDIRAGLYHSKHFFEAYQRICIDQCKQDFGV
jgi:hypothetical protein